jgi:glycosyltransferase involved in cell wall biosynthesis
MVTKGNLFPTRMAVECFLRQTHEDRELVVVCDREAAELRRHIEELGAANIRFVATEHADLGTLRNRSIAAAQGDLICQWDDDDLYHPQRIETMVAELSRTRAAAVFLSRWTLWWPERATLALSGQRTWEGSMLARREALPSYPEASRAEDSALVRTIRAAHPVRLLDRPDLYCYVFHGSNTWPEQHFRAILSRATEVFAAEEYERKLGEIAQAMPVREYGAALAAS